MPLAGVGHDESNRMSMKVVAAAVVAIAMVCSMAHHWRRPAGLMGGESVAYREALVQRASAANSYFVPSTMAIVRKGDVLTVRATKFEKLDVPVNGALANGTRGEWSLRQGGESNLLAGSLRGGLASDYSDAEILGDKSKAIISKGDAAIEYKVTVFETDSTNYHHWTPESGKHYRILWSRSFSTPVK